MFVEGKRSNWKAWLGWIALTAVKIAVVILALFAYSGQNDQPFRFMAIR